MYRRKFPKSENMRPILTATVCSTVRLYSSYYNDYLIKHVITLLQMEHRPFELSGVELIIIIEPYAACSMIACD